MNGSYKKNFAYSNWNRSSYYICCNHHSNTTPGISSPRIKSLSGHSGRLANLSPLDIIIKTVKFIQHEGELLSYQGAATCLACHEEETHNFAASNHYQWEGKFNSINDFCSYPDINFGPGKLTTVNGTQVDGGCAICHAGLGELPTPDNPENADCLMCHAEDYRRTAVDLNGKWRFRPDYENMPTTISIQGEPTRKSCLTCHTYAGGGQNNKRGDISDALIDPTENQDVHMGNGLSCIDCHLSNDNHQIAGRGVDLRIDEGSCNGCVHNVP